MTILPSLVKNITIYIYDSGMIPVLSNIHGEINTNYLLIKINIKVYNHVGYIKLFRPNLFSHNQTHTPQARFTRGKQNLLQLTIVVQ